MFTDSDYQKLQQIMSEAPWKKDLLERLLESHKMEISSISHEIRNPLTLVYSTLQLIEASHPEVHSFKYWPDLHSDIEYMTQLLDELSLYNNSSRLSKTTTNFDTLLKTTVLSFASSLIDTDIEFTSKIQPDLPLMNLDQIKIKEVLLNLLRNAKDAVLADTYRPIGSARPKIHLQATLHAQDTAQSCTACSAHIPEKEEVVIRITDNGCGISPEHLEAIFQPFVTFKKDGTGLGLALSRQIIQAHGGTLTAESELGSSTTFTVVLPV